MHRTRTAWALLAALLVALAVPPDADARRRRKVKRMDNAILFPTKITRAHLSSATNQGGLAPTAPESSELNVGGGDIVVTGTPAAALNLLFEGVGVGAPGTSTVKASLNGGTDDLGRIAFTTWDGNGATERSIVDGSAGDLITSEIIELDTDGDGVNDAAVCIVNNAATATATIRRTTDFSAAAAWVDVASISFGNGARISMVKRKSSLTGTDWLFAITAKDGVLKSTRSVDGGATWASLATIATANPGKIIVLPSGELFVAYTRAEGGFDNLYCKSSADGVLWSTETLISDANVNYGLPTAFAQVNPDTTEGGYKTVVLAHNGTGIVGFESLDANPGNGDRSPTWSAYSETLFAASAYHAWVDATVAPDDTVIVVLQYTNGGTNRLEYSYLKGAGTFPAVATLIDQVDVTVSPMVSIVGGAVWCAFSNTTDDDINLVMTKYWTTYAAGLESWTSATYAQYITPNVWWLLTGGITNLGNQHTIGSDYQYHAARMVQLVRGRPSRSTGDGALWEVIFDAGANNVFPWDTALLMGNFEHAHLQANATNVWTSPSVSEEISMIKTTLAVTSGYTLTGGRATVLAGNLVPHDLVGERIKFAGGTATGAVYTVDDNEAGEIYVAGVDLATVEAGATTLYVLAKRRWITRAVARYRYLRLLIESQQTAENYYEVPALVIGIRKELERKYRFLPTGYVGHMAIGRTAGGRMTREKLGEERRLFLASPAFMSAAVNRHFLAGIRRSEFGRDPFVIIPDLTDSFDFAVVALPDGAYTPNARRFVIPLEEILAP